MDGNKNLIWEIDDKPDNYAKDFMKIRFESNDDLPLSKPLKIHPLTLTIRCVYNENNTYYPQIFLDDCLYEL